MHKQRIVIAVPIEETLLEPLHQWGKIFDFSQVESIHLIHVVRQNITPLEFGLMETPDNATFREMEPTIKKFLEEEAKKIIPEEYKGQVRFIIRKDFHPEEELLELLEELKATLIVVATRGLHGFESLFHRSFTDYMVKNAPCDVFVVRPAQRNKSSKAA